MVAAWNLVEEKGVEFKTLRAFELLGADGAVDDAESLYNVVRTIACQQGLALAIATLCHERALRGDRVEAATIAFTTAINSALTAQASHGKQRMLALAATSEASLNLIAKMSPARGVEFRYIWLEFLCSSPNLAEFAASLDVETARVRSFRDQARHRYVSYVADERTSQLRRLNRTVNVSELHAEMLSQTHNDVAKALARWFDIDSDSYVTWRRDLLQGLVLAPETANDESEQDEDDDDRDVEDELVDD